MIAAGDTIKSFGRAANSLVAKPVKAGAVGSALWLAAAGITAPAAQAKQVVAAMAGTVSGGYDQTGVFGAPKSDLTNEPFTLNCVIDDAKGTGVTKSYPPMWSRIDPTGSIATGDLSSPMTCALTIKGRTLIYGELSADWRTSSVSRNALYSQQFEVGESYNVPYQTAGSGSVSANYYFNQGSTADYNWESPVYSSNTGTTSGGDFFFTHWDVVQYDDTTAVTYANAEAASGSLTITSLSVSGSQYSADEKRNYAQAGAVLYAASKSSSWIGWIQEPFKTLGNATGEMIGAEIFAETVIQRGDIFKAQSLELSKSIVDELVVMTGIQFGLDGKPDKYQMPGKAEMALAIMSFFQALDPPDWNYTTVQPPSALSLPATGDAVVDTFVNDYLTAISYKAAALHAHERWQAATIAGDAASATLQLNAFNTYSGLAEDAEAVLPQDNATLASYLPAVNVNSYPGGANAIAARVNAQCGQPLPAAVNTELLKFMDQATIDDKVCEVASSVRPSDINTNIGALLRAIP